jgi:hypothetical protein
MAVRLVPMVTTGIHIIIKIKLRIIKSNSLLIIWENLLSMLKIPPKLIKFLPLFFLSLR